MVLDMIMGVVVIACGYVLIKTWPSVRWFYKMSRM